MKSAAWLLAEANFRTVLARSVALMPVVKPALASIEIVNAVRRESSFSLTMIGKFRSLARLALMAEQIMPEVWRIRKAMS